MKKKSILFVTFLQVLSLFSCSNGEISSSSSSFESTSTKTSDRHDLKCNFNPGLDQDLEGLTKEQVLEMNQVFIQSEFLPSNAVRYYYPFESCYYGIIKGYAVLHYSYISSCSHWIMEYGSNSASQKYTPCLAYSLEEKKFYSVAYLYEQNVFDDKDMDQIAPYGYIKNTLINEERFTYEVYVNKLEEKPEYGHPYGHPDLDGSQYFWDARKWYYGNFLDYNGLKDKEEEEKLNEDFNHKRTCFAEKNFLVGLLNLI